MSAPRNDDRRQHLRVDAKIRVVFRSKEDLVYEYTQNISGGGIFLKTDKLLDPNAEIELSLVLPENLGEFVVRGRVTRLMSLSHPDEPGRQMFGVGVRFVDPSPPFQAALSQALKM